jgi:hypothetical protein
MEFSQWAKLQVVYLVNPLCVEDEVICCNNMHRFQKSVKGNDQRIGDEEIRM